MEVIYITIPLVLIVGGFAVGVFIWMAKKGQFDDLDGAAYRILLDEDDVITPPKQQASQEKTPEKED